MVEVAFHLNGDTRCLPLPGHNFDSVLYHARLMNRGEIASLIPMLPLDALASDLPGSSQIHALLARDRDSGNHLFISDIHNHLVHDAVSDLIPKAFPELFSKELTQEQLQEELRKIDYGIYPGKGAARSVQNRCRMELAERSIKEFGGLIAIGSPGPIPKIFTEEVWNHIAAFCAVNIDNTERIAALKTQWFWARELNRPALLLHELVEFAAQDVSASGAFVQAHAGSRKFANIVGEQISLLHTHVVKEENHRLAFISDMDKRVMRQQLPGQVSLIANVMIDQPDENPVLHMYSWHPVHGCSIVNEGMYVVSKGRI